ncbi:MAG TPA: hypothetical protein VL914_05020 [Vicinamibacterales bacterium]|jgi:hypothetical protein|nr:hypothetical protein [Vicinamibacterales bacterium]
MMVIKRVGPLSCAKLSGTLYALIGLLVGGIFSMIAMAGGAAADNTFGRGMGAAIGVGAIVLFPILYGCMGFVATLIGAWLYNIVAGMVGGIELDVQ